MSSASFAAQLGRTAVAQPLRQAWRTYIKHLDRWVQAPWLPVLRR